MLLKTQAIIFINCYFENLMMDRKYLIDNVLIGMTGSIGVVTFSEYIFLLRKNIAKNIRVIMSKSATKFITPFSIRDFFR